MTAQWIIALVMAGAVVFMLYNVLELRESLKKQGVPLFGTRIWNLIFHRGEISYNDNGRIRWLKRGPGNDFKEWQKKVLDWDSPDKKAGT